MPNPKELQNLEVKLVVTEEKFELGSPIELTFIIENNYDENQKVCTYYTPIEGFKGKLLNVFNEKGDKVAYTGRMKKRVSPTKEDFIMIKAGESIEHVFTIEDHYSIEASGTYTIQFIGKYINGLPDSNVIEIKIEEK